MSQSIVNILDIPLAKLQTRCGMPIIFMVRNKGERNSRDKVLVIVDEGDTLYSTTVGLDGKHHTGESTYDIVLKKVYKYRLKPLQELLDMGCSLYQAFGKIRCSTPEGVEISVVHTTLYTLEELVGNIAYFDKVEV